MRTLSRAPITHTLHLARPVGKGIGVQPNGANFRRPAFVQTPTNRDVWHTLAARTHKHAPAAATVSLYRYRS
ncbi:MAG: hypothetical protein M0Z46_10485 [Actinomycetota bacterium]|jgi:hypothetical protein|nr:hypothetical protein [Actinomycetota bacterium]